MQYSRTNSEYIHRCAKDYFISYFTKHPDKIEEFNTYIKVDRYTQDILNNSRRYKRSIDYHFEEFIANKPFISIFDKIKEYINNDKKLFRRFCEVYSEITNTPYIHPSASRFYILMLKHNVNMNAKTHSLLEDTFNIIKAENDSGFDQICIQTSTGFIKRDYPNINFIVDIHRKKLKFSLYKRDKGFITFFYKDDKINIQEAYSAVDAQNILSAILKRDLKCA